MKNCIAVLLCLALILALAACGGTQTEAPKTETPAAETEAPKAEAPAQEPEAPAAETEAPAETEDAAAIVAKVLEMKGQPVEDLIDWLGEPLSRDYSNSCLVEGGQDGQLVYPGFTVYTLVQPDGTETVYDCEETW